jgi:hypothetical protein
MRDTQLEAHALTSSFGREDSELNELMQQLVRSSFSSFQRYVAEFIEDDEISDLYIRALQQVEHFEDKVKTHEDMPYLKVMYDLIFFANRTVQEIVKNKNL